METFSFFKKPFFIGSLFGGLAMASQIGTGDRSSETYALQENSSFNKLWTEIHGTFDGEQRLSGRTDSGEYCELSIVLEGPNKAQVIHIELRLHGADALVFQATAETSKVLRDDFLYDGDGGVDLAAEVVEAHFGDHMVNSLHVAATPDEVRVSISELNRRATCDF